MNYYLARSAFVFFGFIPRSSLYLKATKIDKRQLVLNIQIVWTISVQKHLFLYIKTNRKVNLFPVYR